MKKVNINNLKDVLAKKKIANKKFNLYLESVAEKTKINKKN